METSILKWEEVEQLSYKDLRNYAKNLGITFSATPKSEEILAKLKASKHYTSSEKSKQFFIKKDQFITELTAEQKAIYEGSLPYKEKVVELFKLKLPQYKIAVLFEVKWSEINEIVKSL